MSKRVGFLYEKIYEWDNLLNAFNKAKKGKSNKQEILKFEYNLENRLITIQKQFEDQNYKFSSYKTFQIYEPKERTISCAPFQDRVIHHAICNIINPIIDKSIISDSYACRKGKGLHKAIRRGFYFFKNNEYCYKFDIQKYFYTIDQEILFCKLARKFKDKKLLSLIAQLLKTYQTDETYYFPFEKDNIFDYARSRGLPIGNLTSQVFANFYLSEFDHYVKEKLHQKNYIRYMDDVLIFSNNIEELKEIKNKIKLKLAELRLQLHPNKNTISKTKAGINFLGFRYKNNRINCKKSSRCLQK